MELLLVCYLFSLYKIIERFGHTYEKPKRAAYFTTIFRLKFDVLGVAEKN